MDNSEQTTFYLYQCIQKFFMLNLYPIDQCRNIHPATPSRRITTGKSSGWLFRIPILLHSPL